MNLFFRYSYLLLVVGAFFGCSPKNAEIAAEKLPKEKLPVMLASLDSLSKVKRDYFYAKIGTDYKDSAQNVSFKTSVRIVADSAVNAVITFARIPVMNALITSDSVKITDKRAKCYSEESLDYFRKTFGVDFNLRNIEQLLQGLPVAFDENEKYYRVNDPYNHTVTSHRKRDIRKSERLGEKEVISTFTLSDDLKSMKSMMIESIEDTAVVSIRTVESQIIDEHLVPSKVEIRIITPAQEIQLNLEYKKVRINEKEDIFFIIPESYEVCE